MEQFCDEKKIIYLRVLFMLLYYRYIIDII